jgi:hypothetical protein
VLDIPHIFRIAGGPRGLLTLMNRHDPDHGALYNSVQMWQQRKQIPTKWVGLVLYVLLIENYELSQFFVDPDELGRSC